MQPLGVLLDFLWQQWFESAPLCELHQVVEGLAVWITKGLLTKYPQLAKCKSASYPFLSHAPVVNAAVATHPRFPYLRRIPKLVRDDTPPEDGQVFKLAYLTGDGMESWLDMSLPLLYNWDCDGSATVRQSFTADLRRWARFLPLVKLRYRRRVARSDLERGGEIYTLVEDALAALYELMKDQTEPDLSFGKPNFITVSYLCKYWLHVGGLDINSGRTFNEMPIQVLLSHSPPPPLLLIPRFC